MRNAKQLSGECRLQLVLGGRQTLPAEQASTQSSAGSARIPRVSMPLPDRARRRSPSPTVLPPSSLYVENLLRSRDHPPAITCSGKRHGKNTVSPRNTQATSFPRSYPSFFPPYSILRGLFGADRLTKRKGPEIAPDRGRLARLSHVPHSIYLSLFHPIAACSFPHPPSP